MRFKKVTSKLNFLFLLVNEFNIIFKSVYLFTVDFLDVSVFVILSLQMNFKKVNFNYKFSVLISTY